MHGGAKVTTPLECAERWVAWNKPPGIPVFPPHADPAGDCLLARIGRDDVAWPVGFEGGIAHRLDTPTSGQLLAARSPADLGWLRNLFRTRQLRKVYRFVSYGQVAWDEHQVDTPIAHDKRKRSKMLVQRGKNTPHRGKWYPAHTEFRRLSMLQGGGALWEAVITTGVMHQIRVHAAWVGIPLHGDKRYGGGDPVEANVPFFLHHVGLSGPGLQPQAAPIPDFWPISE
jgi:23S rRNA pseudouridine1911/1915/1917 synthase